MKETKAGVFEVKYLIKCIKSSFIKHPVVVYNQRSLHTNCFHLTQLSQNNHLELVLNRATRTNTHI